LTQNEKFVRLMSRPLKVCICFIINSPTEIKESLDIMYRIYSQINSQSVCSNSDILTYIPCCQIGMFYLMWSLTCTSHK